MAIGCAIAIGWAAVSSPPLQCTIPAPEHQSSPARSTVSAPLGPPPLPLPPSTPPSVFPSEVLSLSSFLFRNKCGGLHLLTVRKMMGTSEKLWRTLPVNFPGSWESSDTRQHRQLQSIVERLRTVVKSRGKPVLSIHPYKTLYILSRQISVIL